MELEKKKVAILGLGVENRALLDFLIKKGKEVVVCDRNEKIRRLKGVKEWRLGKDYLKNLTDFEIVFRTPGIPYLTPEIQKAKKEGVEISSATKLFFDLCPAKIIGITGTKGKGTTAALIYEILCSALDSQVYLAGNIGNPAIALLSKLKPSDWVILELSSFQLQDLKKSPHIAVILNITPDHLDYHKTKSEYERAKENILRYQKKEDFAVISADYFTSFRFATLTKGQVFWFSRRKSVDQGAFIKRKGIVLRIGRDFLVSPISSVRLRGLHNLENILAASVASYLAGASVSDIKKVIETFRGLEHRLEFVRKLNGVSYMNDSFSTTPETTIAALESFKEPIVLICGGRSKGGDYDKLVKAVVNSTVKSIILIGELAKEIKSKIENQNSKFKIKIENLGFKKMEEIVKTAQKEAKEGDVVLFSPGAASFDMFKNATERGNQFKKVVKALK